MASCTNADSTIRLPQPLSETNEGLLGVRLDRLDEDEQSGVFTYVYVKVKKPATSSNNKTRRAMRGWAALLDDAFTKDDLKGVCERQDLGVGGNKQELIKRILAEVTTPGRVKEPLLHLFPKDALKDACDRLDLASAGNKPDIVKRIMKAKKF